MNFGNITLNVSTGIYLISYLPQLKHNEKKTNISHVSILFHLIFYVGYLLDLLYGFGLQMPWQYKLVSGVGLSYLLVQHYQLYKTSDDELFKYLTLGVVTSLLLMITTIFFKFNHFIYLSAGVISEICFWIYMAPQFYKNYQTKNSQALSLGFLLLGLLAVICDNCSAWYFAWPFPSKLGACVSLLMYMLLLWQYWQYKPRYGVKPLDFVF